MGKGRGEKMKLIYLSRGAAPFKGGRDEIGGGKYRQSLVWKFAGGHGSGYRDSNRRRGRESKKKVSKG